MKAILKTYRPDIKVKNHTFFIQSRGHHAGRPLVKPIPNCFLVELPSEAEYERYFAVVQALFNARRFERYLLGSVVELIRIGDVRKVITEGLLQMERHPLAFAQTVKATTAVDAQVLRLEQQLALLKQLKQAYLQQWLSKS